MKYYVFKNESNKFDDILSDPTIKTQIKHKISWLNHLLLGFSEGDKSDNLFGYIVLKYGESIVNPVERDYSPIPYKDYIPSKN